MKRYVNILYGITALLIFTTTGLECAWGQSYVNTPVEISKEKVKVDGKVCYSHVVLERQTLYSISKAYGISIDDIYRFNPTVKENGLKKNSIILIPSQEAINSSYGTARKDTVNTSASRPVKETKKEQSGTQRIHIAKWYEDLDVIAEQYGVTAADIMIANNLNGRKLNRRQKLVIPYPGEKIAEAAPESPAVPAAEERVATKEATVVPEKPDTTTSVTVIAPDIKRSATATLMLPLTDSEGEPSRHTIDFYCGALVAVRDMAEKGVECNLNVYDIMDPQSRMNAGSIAESDFIIGPISTADLTRLLGSDADAKTIISPLDPRAESLAAENSRIIQIPTPHHIQYKDIVKWIEEDYRDGDRVVMVTEKGARQSDVTLQMKAALDSSALKYEVFSYSILEGRDITEPLTNLMSTEGANRILISSESEAFVNDVVRNLNLLIYNNLDIALYAPSKIRSFETIEVENFHNSSMRVSIAYYTDYNSMEVKDFLLKYRALFNTEPTQFAFQGYDIMTYFIGLCATYGENWREKLAENPKEMLQSTFKFTQLPSGGFINNGIRRIIYGAGYEIKREK